ncbi:carbohydrate ABC transporter permease [Thermofilum pendens]|uniref:Binding-protein-dependent transport systems inner membrane component n=1 Tax=Thermofilum pendens (strain DSM 2475 / Hrk 5) TaxID=368408 RepID=A1RZE3_THEPD|nr:sugar ABC transporter permease [Thermofilum pendens]ABL78573.1 binding-protein-dependent transport systems inner membrane component [Thermofilum pendens Hrk 5]
MVRLSRRMSKYLVMALFLLPAAAIIVLFLVVPSVLTILISLTNLDYRFKWEWVGLSNYQTFVSDPNTPIFVRNTIIYVTGTLAFNVGVGLLLALLSTHVHDALGTFMRAAWYLPRVLPSVIWAFVMMWIFSPMDTGFLNSLLKSAGLSPVPWTFKYYWPFLYIVNGFIGCSLGMVIFSSAIKSIPQDLIVAAKVDGASGLTIVRRIILPLIKWHIAFVVAYQTLSLLASFEYILLTLDGGPGYYSTEVMILQAYHLAFGQYLAAMRYGYAAVFVTILLVIGLVLSVVYWKVFRLHKLMAEPVLE